MMVCIVTKEDLRSYWKQKLLYKPLKYLNLRIPGEEQYRQFRIFVAAHSLTFPVFEAYLLILSSNSYLSLSNITRIMMSLADILGYGAAFCTTAAYVPQAIKVYRTRHTKDISLGMFLILICGLLFWLIYGFLLNSTPIILANIVTVFLAAYILVMKIRLDYLGKAKGQKTEIKI